MRARTKKKVMKPWKAWVCVGRDGKSSRLFPWKAQATQHGWVKGLGMCGSRVARVLVSELPPAKKARKR